MKVLTSIRSKRPENHKSTGLISLKLYYKRRTIYNKTMSKIKPSVMIICSVIVALLVIGGGAFALMQRNDKKSGDNSADSKNNASVESTQGDAKQEIVDEQNNPPSPEDLANAQLTIVDATYYTQQPGAMADAVEVRAFVGNTVASDGVCKITVSSTKSSIVRDAATEPDAKSTWCKTVTIPIDKMQFDAEAPWSVKVEYNSPTMNGQAEAKLGVM